MHSSLAPEAAEGMQASRGGITAKLVNASGSAAWTFDLLVSRQPMPRSYTGGLLNQPLVACPAEGAGPSCAPA